jgi:ubiquinone/menaquinone biosynthesis C-methylase UbiE
MPAESRNEFQPTWNPYDVFTGTAYYYARYRPHYPDAAIKLLVEKFGLDKNSRVLDLGCGPGHLALALAPRAGRVFAVDPQEEMLAEGRRLAQERGLTNIEWIQGQSRGLPSLRQRVGRVNLTVMGRSFHWMDRRRTLRDLYAMTVPGGGIALLADSDVTTLPDGVATLAASNAIIPEQPAWRRLIRETTRKWLGEERKAGVSGTYAHPKKHHQEVVADSEFTGMELVHLQYQRTWTVDEIIGYLYSTSSHSIPVLGEKKDAFEADLRQRLSASEPSGVFSELVMLQVIMAWKPAG